MYFSHKIKKKIYVMKSKNKPYDEYETSRY